MHWPYDYKKEAQRRKVLSDAFWSLDDPRAEFIKRYKDDPVAFIIDWCWTYDPRNNSKNKSAPVHMPFLLFPKQVELVEWLQSCVDNEDDGLLEKARDMGASWVACGFTVWLWLLHPGAAIGWGSRKEEYVDRIGDPKTIFWKVRYLIEKLPPFAKPIGYDPKRHATYMKIINPENGSTVTGEAGDNIGRGGRTLIYFKDESAHYERPELIEAALGDNTNVQIDISSVNGTGNVFYRRRHGGMVKVFVMDWRDHPGKDQAWYDKRKQKAESEGLLHVFAQEVDRDYAGAVQGVIIPGTWVRSALDAHINLDMEIVGGRQAGLDIADEGGDTNALAVRDGVLLESIEEWGEGDTSDTAQRAVGECDEVNCATMRYDSVGVGAGVKADIRKEKEREQDNNVDGPYSKIIAIPYNGGSSVHEPEKQFTEGKKNKDMFKNLKAQDWWGLRTRFYKTHRMVNGLEEYPHDELISLDSKIPLIHKLVNELSQPTRKYDTVNRILVDKKPEGTKSPNLADAVVMAYSSVGPKKIRMAFI